MRIGDDEREVIPGDGIAIPPGAIHRIHNQGAAGLVFLCCCAAGYEDEDTILAESPRNIK